MRKIRRAGRRALAAVFVVAVLPVAASTPAGAQPAADLLRLAQQTPFVEANGVFSLRLRVAGAPPGAELRFAVRDRVRTRTEFTRTLEGRSLRAQLAPALPSAPLTSFPSDSTGTVLVRIPTHTAAAAEETSVRLASEGVYPVVVELVDADGDRVDQLITHLVRVPPAGDDFPALSVAVVLPIAAPPSVQPDGSVVVDPEVRGGATALVAAMQSHPDVALTLVPTPETLEALVADQSPGEQDVVRSARSALAGREVLGSTYVRTHPGAWLDAGLSRALGDALTRGHDVVGDALGRLSRATWSADAGLDVAGLEWLESRGVDSFVVPEAALTTLDPSAFPTTLARPFRLRSDDGPKAASADAGLAAHVGASNDPVLDAARLVADLATIYFDEPNSERGAVLVVPPDWKPSADFLEPFLSALEPSRLLDPVTIGEFLRDVPEATIRRNRRNVPLVRDLQPADAPDLGEFGGAFPRGRTVIDTCESVTGPDNPLVDSLRRRLLVGGAVGFRNRERVAYVEGVEATVDAEYAKVEPPPRQTITLTGRSGRVPLLVRNHAGYPVTVVVRLQADRLEFPDHPDGRITLQLDEETTRLELRVRTRASGDSPLDLRLLTADGRRELGSTRFTVRSTAVSGVGIILSVGAGVVLVVWWIRNARDARRPRRAHQ